MGRKLMAILSCLVFLLSASIPLIDGQPGFISVDCGKPTDHNYKDEKTSILYTSDSFYIDTGDSHNISSEVLAASLNVQTQDLRSFPNGKRNCYSLNPVTEGKKYIVRAFFLYGNYDRENDMPQFDLYLDTNFWASVKITNSSQTYMHEQFAAATGKSISVCLVDTGLGRPFVSALELRPIGENASYAEKVDKSVSLTMVKRVNFGGPANSYVRYPEDIYDRIWEPFSASSWTQLSTEYTVRLGTDDNLPLQIMQTAVTPTSGSSLDFSWPVDAAKGRSRYYLSKHFAELVQLKSNETRVFNMSEDGSDVFSQFSPVYLSLTTYYNRNPYTYDKLDFSIYKTVGSTLPPIINAMEIYMINPLKENATFAGDVEAILDIKAAFKIQKYWTGDPCAPVDFTWDGLKCSYNDKPYRINSLDLRSSGLTGSIPSSLANLTQLKYLDLSMNNLTGGIPSFLASLADLELLNLTCSGLKGPTPTELNRSSIRLLFSDSCIQVHQSSDSGKSKKNVLAIVLPIVGVLLFLLLLLLLLGIYLIRKRRKTHGPNPTKTDPAPAIHVIDPQWSQPYCRTFTTSELIKMTDNYQKKIGKGGSGEVFYGLLEKGKPVAVKKLTKLTPNSLTQFQAEINALKRIHHRNLVPFIGYCEDKDGLALVYEYMPNGSLADHLAGKAGGSEILTWNKRLQLASEAAQGLEYLHVGCQRPIVHRDVKAANILLTENMEARIADFGLSKIFAAHGDLHALTNVMGTPGYLDPEYSKTGILTEKSDVYSFGIVLLELITGLPRYFGSTERTHIVEHVEGLLSNGDLQVIVDKNLLGTYEVNSAWKAIGIAIACTAPNAVDRPTMSEVLVQLKDCCVTSEVTSKLTNDSDTNSFAGTDPRSFTGYMTSPSAR